MNIKGMIFDKDGTLMDFASFWIPVAENAVKNILEMVGGDFSLSDKMLSSIGAYSGIRGILLEERKWQELTKIKLEIFVLLPILTTENQHWQTVLLKKQDY